MDPAVQRRPVIFAILLLALPWLIAELPMIGRVYAVAILLSEGALFWWWRRPLGPLLLTSGVGSFWIALASIPLELSKLPSGVLYALVTLGMLLPWLGRPSPRRLRVWLLVWVVMVQFARPGRRFEGGEAHPELRAFAAQAATPRDAVALVHEAIQRRPAPFADRAVDTLRRGRGHCGAMNNLLHKVLLARGVDAEILHLDLYQGMVHTLVGFRDGAGQYFLADAQENVVRAMSPADLFTADPDSLPPPWRGVERIYRYSVSDGYVRLKAADAVSASGSAAGTGPHPGEAGPRRPAPESP